MTEVLQLAPGLVGLRAANPSPMTGTGTNTYVIATAQGAVVIDPGPALPAHLAAIMNAAPNGVAAILLTHPHLDHSALIPDLVAKTGAPAMGFGPASAGRSPVMQRLAEAGLRGGGEGIDAGFRPDRALLDGDKLGFGEVAIEVVHTPGHMGGHLSFAMGDVLFGGDHVMGWASTLISPPDGDVGAYMSSLARLSARNWRRIYPGHGASIEQPAKRLAELIAHRRAREAAIKQALGKTSMTANALTAQVYTDIAPNLLPAAARNILAHLIDLHERNVVGCDDLLSPAARFHLI